MLRAAVRAAAGQGSQGCLSKVKVGSKFIVFPCTHCQNRSLKFLE